MKPQATVAKRELRAFFFLILVSQFSAPRLHVTEISRSGDLRLQPIEGNDDLCIPYEVSENILVLQSSIRPACHCHDTAWTRPVCSSQPWLSGTEFVAKTCCRPTSFHPRRIVPPSDRVIWENGFLRVPWGVPSPRRCRASCNPGYYNRRCPKI